MHAATTPRARARRRPPSLGELLSKTIRDANALMVAEIDLAKAELRESKAQLQRAAVLLAIVSVVSLAGLIVLLLGLALALSLFIPVWAAHLCVALAALTTGGVLAKRALTRLQGVDPAPQLAIENTKEDVECIKETLTQRSLASSRTSNATALS
ncbi:MAG: phage holin family protein [Nannocystaceae bacterium]|nr:phage holin family protein [bacterium]